MTHVATISGMEMEFPDSKVSARELMAKIHPLMGWDTKGYPYHQVDDFYYLPRQNRPRGVTGDGPYLFDLEECSDFTMAAVPMEGGEERFEGLNLYNWEVQAEQRAEQERLDAIERDLNDETLQHILHTDDIESLRAVCETYYRKCREQDKELKHFRSYRDYVEGVVLLR